MTSPTNDVLCELAHELTVRECRFKQIPLDADDDGETVYSRDAQLVFDSIYEIVPGVLECNAKEVQP